jgi:hypothetical protein
VQPGVAAASGGLSAADSAREEPQVRFVSGVLDDAQQTWARVLPKYGAPYRDAKPGGLLRRRVGPIGTAAQ